MNHRLPRRHAFCSRLPPAGIFSIDDCCQAQIYKVHSSQIEDLVEHEHKFGPTSIDRGVGLASKTCCTASVKRGLSAARHLLQLSVVLGLLTGLPGVI